MKKSILLKGLECPNCAAKIENEIRKLEGVTGAAVNLMKQTLSLEFNEKYTDIISEIEKIVHSHEPDVEVIELEGKKRQDESKDMSEDESEWKEARGALVRLGIGALLFVLGLVMTSMVDELHGFIVLLAAYIILGGDIVKKALKNIVRGQLFDENFLMSVSSIGAFAIGEAPEGVAVMLFYQLGEFFQGLSVRRSRKSIARLMDIRPEMARVCRGDEMVEVEPEQVKPGEVIVVKPGERVPLDGIVTKGGSMLDTRALTGESVPRSVHEGELVLSGCINQTQVLTIEVKRSYSESTATRILEMVEHASEKKAPTENFITSFARVYTPIVVVFALLLALVPPIFAGQLWSEWLHRGMVFLVISCPCALVLSIPLAFFGGIGAAAKSGVLVKGGNYLEALNHIDTIVFDKTGTLTKGVFKVTEILPSNAFSDLQLLELAATAECFSNHPIAKSILEAYGSEIDRSTLHEQSELPGLGVSVRTGTKQILAGNASLLEQEGISFVPSDRAGTKVYVAVNGVYAGCILIADELKPDSADTITRLKSIGVKSFVMLTGDDEKIAAEIAHELGINKYRAELLPNQKVEVLEKIKKETGGKVAFVGDGLNDAPVLASADIGIAMGALGSDAAIEAADIVLMTDEMAKLKEAITAARRTKRIVTQNIWISLGVKLMFLMLGAFGVIGMWEAVFGDVGVALIAVFNSMRVVAVTRIIK